MATILEIGSRLADGKPDGRPTILAAPAEVIIFPRVSLKHLHRIAEAIGRDRADSGDAGAIG
jgi:hypothetical protein